jgi:hypothetical protein
VSTYIYSAYWLGATVIGAALVGIVPAAIEIADYIQYARGPGTIFVARWAFVLLLIGALEAAYGIYLIQLPDWSSARVVTAMLLAPAALYAMALAVVLIADPGGWLLGSAGLQLADRLAGGKAALWCVCMISLSTLIAFFAGRLAASWRRSEIVRGHAGL